MKKLFFVLMFASTIFIVPQGTKAQGISFRDFYSSLSPYGEWVTVGDYGRCWRPIGTPIGWRPYTDGHWVWTEYGWTWVSGYPWGWAAFHYGRWTFDPEYGWVWVPDYVWAPAWVEWRWGGGYCGWAPMPPGFHFRVDVVVTGDNRDFGVGMGGWIFIRADDMGRDRYRFVERAAVPRAMGSTRNVTEFRFTSGGVYNSGLHREEVERFTHRRIETIAVERSNEAGQERLEGNRVRIYSPAPFAPQVRNEGPGVRNGRSSNPHPGPQRAAPPVRSRERYVDRHDNPGKAQPHYQPRRDDRGKPAKQENPKNNDRGRERESKPRDNGPGRHP